MEAENKSWCVAVSNIGAWAMNVVSSVGIIMANKQLMSANGFAFSFGGRMIDKRRASMSRDTVEVLLCGGDWIKEAYDIRSFREPNDDPIELEYDKEYEMEDPPSNATATPPAPTAPSAVQSDEVQVASATQATPSTDKRSLSGKPPKKKHAKIRRT